MRAEVVWLLLGMAAVTFLPRFLPLALLSRLTLNPRLRAGLGYMPVAILSAIVFPILLSTSEQALAFQPQMLLAVLPVVMLAYFFKNLWLAVLAGMLTYWLLGMIW